MHNLQLYEIYTKIMPALNFIDFKKSLCFFQILEY